MGAVDIEEVPNDIIRATVQSLNGYEEVDDIISVEGGEYSGNPVHVAWQVLWMRIAQNSTLFG